MENLTLKQLKVPTMFDRRCIGDFATNGGNLPRVKGWLHESAVTEDRRVESPPLCPARARTQH